MEVTWPDVDYFSLLTLPSSLHVEKVTSHQAAGCTDAATALQNTASHCAHRKKKCWTWRELLHCLVAVGQKFNTSSWIHLIRCIFTEWKWVRVWLRLSIYSAWDTRLLFSSEPNIRKAKLKYNKPTVHKHLETAGHPKGPDWDGCWSRCTWKKSPLLFC